MKKRKKFEFSKLILLITGIFAVIVTIFTMVIVCRTGDTSALGYLIPAIFAEVATATGFYYSKAKSENRIKLTKIYGKEAVEKSENETNGSDLNGIY